MENIIANNRFIRTNERYKIWNSVILILSVIGLHFIRVKYMVVQIIWTPIKVRFIFEK